MKKILAFIIFILLFTLNNNFVKGYFPPSYPEVLKEKYNSIINSRSVLSKEDKKFIKDYKNFLEFEKQEEKAYNERISKRGYEETKSQTAEEAKMEIINSEPKMQKIARENPDFTFSQIYEIFKKENPELIEKAKKGELSERSGCEVRSDYCPIDGNRYSALKYALRWTSNTEILRNSKYKNFGENDCTNFASQVLEAGNRSQIKYFSNGSTKDIKNWFNNWWSSSESWRLVDKFRENLINNSSSYYPKFEKKYNINSLEEGDLILMNRGGGRFDHIGIITKRGKLGWDYKLSYHGNDSNNILWSDVQARIENDGFFNSEYEYWKVNYNNF